MRTAQLLALAVGTAITTGCDDARLGAPDLTETHGRAQGISVMTWNVFAGTDMDAVVAALANADPSDDFPALMAALETLQATDWPTRARGFADQIAADRPHVVGLQEISTFDIDLTAYGVGVDFTLPFLPVLQAELAARGLTYEVAAIIENFNAQPVPGIAVQDFDVLLFDADRVGLLESGGQLFTEGIGEVAPGIVLRNGWVSAKVDVAGRVYTVASTHLAAGKGAQLTGLRYLQALELAAALGPSDRVIVMGDLNDWDNSPMYDVFTSAGFTDAWRALRPGVDGSTCCHKRDLSNERAQLNERIDYVLTRGIGHSTGKLVGSIERLGAQPAYRLPGPYYRLWPSDHAGLYAKFVLPSPNDAVEP